MRQLPLIQGSFSIRNYKLKPPRNLLPQVPDPPLPYTGIYDKHGQRIVNIKGKWAKCNQLNFMEKLARNGPPYCLRSTEDKKHYVTMLKRKTENLANKEKNQYK